MNSTTYNRDNEVQMMLDKFDQVSTKDNTTIIALSTSIQFKCKCGCMKVEQFAGPFHKKHEKYFVELCDNHKLDFKQPNYESK
jgi:hypothetical protein